MAILLPRENIPPRRTPHYLEDASCHYVTVPSRLDLLDTVTTRQCIKDREQPGARGRGMSFMGGAGMV